VTGGSGLGLTLARAIAREHGGEIVLCNRMAEGQIIGLRASLRLPREKARSRSETPGSAAAEAFAS
jgi:signal transduction histidine kinase